LELLFIPDLKIRIAWLNYCPATRLKNPVVPFVILNPGSQDPPSWLSFFDILPDRD
jgi:hypothetical protein